MKKYNVIIKLVVNPSRDIDLKVPELETFEVEVIAKDENEAREKGKAIEWQRGRYLSVWESWAEEINVANIN